MTGTEPLTPDAMRALIEEVADIVSGEFEGSEQHHLNLLNRALPMLSALLPREDAELDTIERTLGTRTEVECPRCEGSGEGPDLSDCSLCLGNCAVAANSPEAMKSLARSLLARVRTAEAERHEAQRRLGVIADSAQDGLADCDDDHDMSAYWVLMVATGQDEEDTRPRTVETAEETGASMIVAERATHPARGYDAEHDVEHWRDLLKASIAYVWHALGHRVSLYELDQHRPLEPWPWARGYWKPRGRIRTLVKAGALIAASIDSLIAAGEPVPSTPEEQS